jgi:hypothetical protein
MLFMVGKKSFYGGAQVFKPSEGYLAEVSAVGADVKPLPFCWKYLIKVIVEEK